MNKNRAYSFKFAFVIHRVSNKSTVSYLDQLIGQRHALDFKDLKLHQNVSPLFYENFFMGKGFFYHDHAAALNQ